MLVTPSNSTRTVRPATAVTNHMKVRRREKAGRSRRIAFHQIPHSDSGSPRSGMVASMVQVGSGHPIGTMPPPSAPYSTNDNWVLSPVSGFWGGAITEHIGAFAQVTYEAPGAGVPS